ncbi:MAG: OmpA family protein [Burkholderiaceae bacterium]|jgi:peptidoglycan-associated lipoprotein|nr:OmpA family protein [Burkholderiaceae bacterium]
MSLKLSWLPKALAGALLSAMMLTQSGCVVKRYDWVEVPPPVYRKQISPSPSAQAPKPTRARAQAPERSAGDFKEVGDLVFFDTDTAELSAEARHTLERQADWLKRHPQASIRVEGNADRRASAKYNQALGQSRADAVKKYLIAHGVDAARITAVSNSYWKPIASGKSARAMASNRNARSIVTTASKP